MARRCFGALELQDRVQRLLSPPENIIFSMFSHDFSSHLLDFPCLQPQDSRCGMLIPRPQYPLYSAALTMTGGRICFYDMHEEKGWRTSRESLEGSAQAAEQEGAQLRAITVINPGNPVGAVLDREDVEMLIQFATERQLVILADEVYQENVYREGKAFHSFKKVLRELQQEDFERYKAWSVDSMAFLSCLSLAEGLGRSFGAWHRPQDTQLISFHSTSKGIMGECGQRGGFVEYVGFSPEVLAQFNKMAATSLASNTLGQAT